MVQLVSVLMGTIRISGSALIVKLLTVKKASL